VAKKDFIKILTEGTLINPLSPNYSLQYVFHEGEEPLALVELDYKPAIWGPDSVWLAFITALSKGGGRKTMEILIERADRHGITLKGDVVPVKSGFHKKKYPVRKLVDWYKQFGFKVTSKIGHEIERKPKQGMAENPVYPKKWPDDRPRKFKKGDKVIVAAEALSPSWTSSREATVMYSAHGYRGIMYMVGLSTGGEDWFYGEDLKHAGYEENPIYRKHWTGSPQFKVGDRVRTNKKGHPWITKGRVIKVEKVSLGVHADPYYLYHLDAGTEYPAQIVEEYLEYDKDYTSNPIYPKQWPTQTPGRFQVGDLVKIVDDAIMWRSHTGRVVNTSGLTYKVEIDGQRRGIAAWFDGWELKHIPAAEYTENPVHAMKDWYAANRFKVGHRIQVKPVTAGMFGLKSPVTGVIAKATTRGKGGNGYYLVKFDDPKKIKAEQAGNWFNDHELGPVGSFKENPVYPKKWSLPLFKKGRRVAAVYNTVVVHDDGSRTDIMTGDTGTVRSEKSPRTTMYKVEWDKIPGKEFVFGEHELEGAWYADLS